MLTTCVTGHNNHCNFQCKNLYNDALLEVKYEVSSDARTLCKGSFKKDILLSFHVYQLKMLLCIDVEYFLEITPSRVVYTSIPKIWMYIQVFNHILISAMKGYFNMSACSDSDKISSTELKNCSQPGNHSGSKSG